MKKLLLICIMMLNVNTIVYAQQCTTSPEIYYQSSIMYPPDVTASEAKQLIITMFHNKTKLHNSTFVGNWFYEGQSGNSIFVGLQIRSHYLKLQLSFDDNLIYSTVCDSKNLKQRRWSIHRKVPMWKTKFESQLRMAMNTQPTPVKIYKPINSNSNSNSNENELDRLLKCGAITVEQYLKLKNELKQAGSNN